MIRVVYNNNFLKSVTRLPRNAQQKLANLTLLLQENPFHAQLHTKHLTGILTGFLSFRITRDWRVIFRFLNEQTIQLLETAHRKDIYK